MTRKFKVRDEMRNKNLQGMKVTQKYIYKTVKLQTILLPFKVTERDKLKDMTKKN